MMLLTLLIAVAITITVGYEMWKDLPGGLAVASAADLTTLPGTVFQVAYTANTVVVDRTAALKTLKSVSSDGSTLVFEQPPDKIAALHEGNVLLLQGLALRKITSVTPQGSQMIVVTEPAALTEAIQEGNIQWQAPVDFTAAQADARPHFFDLATVHAAGLPALKGKYKEWDYSVTATPAAGRLNLDLRVFKQLKGLEVELTGTGYLQNFTTSAAIQIHDGVLQDMKYANQNLNGKMEFTWSAKTSDSEFIMGKPEIKIPANISIPLPIGGLPFTLEISEAMIIKPALSGKNEIATGKFTVTYNGTDRFSLNGEAGGEDSHTSPEILNTSGVTIAPMAFIGALAMPRIELKLSGMSIVKKLVPSELADAAAGAVTKLLGSKVEGLVEDKLKSDAAAYVEIVTTVAFLHSGPLNIVPCQKTTVTTTVKTGASANFLGQSIGDKEIELVSEKKEERVPENIKCGDSDPETSSQ